MKIAKIFKGAAVVLSLALLTLAAGCATAPRVARPDQLIAPEPIHSNTGKFMCPYTSDEVLAEWVDNAIKAKAAGSIGGAIGAYAGAKALEQIPFVGGFLGEKVGNKIGKEIAIKSAGGMEFITKSSDLSFNSMNDMSIYLYAKYSANEHYQDALNAVFSIYPEFKQGYHVALAQASQNVR